MPPSPTANPASRNADEPSWVLWSGLLSLDNAERDRQELERLLTEPPFTKVEVECSGEHNLVSIRAEFPKGDRILASRALQMLLERLLEHTGADMRTGPFHPKNYRQDDHLGDLRWGEDFCEWHFRVASGVSGTIRPPDPPELPAPQLPLLARWWREIQGLFHRDELRRKQRQERSDRYRDMDIGPQLEIAKRIVATIDNFKRQVKEGAADHLHELYNSNWSDGKFIDRHEFLRRISLDRIRIEPDGAVKACLDDGELFRLHVIVVQLDKHGSVRDATIEG